MVLTQQEHWITHKTKSIVLRSKICLAVINIGDKKKVHIEESPYLEILGSSTTKLHKQTSLDQLLNYLGNNLFWKNITN